MKTHGVKKLDYNFVNIKNQGLFIPNQSSVSQFKSKKYAPIISKEYTGHMEERGNKTTNG